MWKTDVPPALWGFLMGAFAGLGFSLLKPNVLPIVGSTFLFGLTGALTAWLVSTLVERRRWRQRRW